MDFVVIVVFALERLVITVVLCAGVRSGAFAYQLAVLVTVCRNDAKALTLDNNIGVPLGHHWHEE